MASTHSVTRNHDDGWLGHLLKILKMPSTGLSQGE
jgi:hypothetical protein